MRFAGKTLDRLLTPHEETCSCPGAQEARHKTGKRKETDDLPLLGCDCEECTEMVRLWDISCRPECTCARKDKTSDAKDHAKTCEVYEFCIPR